MTRLRLAVGTPGALVLAILGGCTATPRANADEGECSPATFADAGLSADAPVAVTSATVEQLPDGDARYCLVRLRVGGNVNIAAGLPMDGNWNGDIQAEGEGGYGGKAEPPVESVARGFLGVQTDTGHPAGTREAAEEPVTDWRNTNGAFAMSAPGVPNEALQQDYAHRASHLMAVLSRQLAEAFYRRPNDRAYWNGCSTEGRQGLRAAQQYPADYDGILTGDPPIRFGGVMAFQIWPQLVMNDVVGHTIAPAKLELATARAIAACDALDGLVDELITDPRRCSYSAAGDTSITRANCADDDTSCLAPSEAEAIDMIWNGPRDTDGRLLWRGVERGAPLNMLAGPAPFPYAIVQPRYWVYLDPTWDWRQLALADYPAFFAKSTAAVDPVMAADNPDLSAFFARGGKIIAYHGFDDGGILPQGTIDYVEQVARQAGETPEQMQDRMQLYLLPGVGHCGGGDAPQADTDAMMDALVQWVERGKPPADLTAAQSFSDGSMRTRPLCPYPTLSYYRGSGDPAAAKSFACRTGPAG